MLKDNRAKVLGQSIFNNNNIKLINTSVTTQETNSAYHIQSDRGIFIMENSSISIHREDEFMVREVNSGVFVTSPSIGISDFIYTCPNNLNIKTTNFSTTSDINSNETMVTNVDSNNTSLATRKYNFITIACEPCDYGFYILDKGNMRVVHVQQTSQIKKQKCLKCPTGGRCDVKITALDNF